MLTAVEERWLDRRRRLVRLWPWVGSGMVVMIVGFGATCSCGGRCWPTRST